MAFTSSIGLRDPIYSGSGISFEPRGHDDVSTICQYIFSRAPLSRNLATCGNLRNVFWKTSPEYLEAFRAELQNALLVAFEHRGEANDELFNLFVHQTLSLFPFAYPEEGFEVQIPVKDDEGWRLANYTLERKFDMTNGWFPSPLPAYGFVGDGPPQLVFMGTTYPAGRGFMATLFSDFFPGHSVGQMPMRLGKEALNEWLEGKDHVHASGISLGGALSLRAAKEFGANISEVYANLPPGFNPWELKNFHAPDTEINLCFQKGDKVSNLGFFPEGENVHLFHICGEEEQNSFAAHAKVFGSSPNVTLLRGSPEYENQRLSRKLFTAFHLIISPLLFLLFLPFQLVNQIFNSLAKLIE